MAMWLETLLADLKQVTEVQAESVQPSDEGCRHQHPVGTLDADLRKLHFLRIQHERRSREIAASLPYCGNAEREELERAHMIHERQADAIHNAFWVSCRSAFPELWGKPYVAIRKGWEVVWSDHPTGGSLNMFDALLRSSLFDALFGDHEPEDDAEHR